jgi:hypothetical protein
MKPQDPIPLDWRSFVAESVAELADAATRSDA